MRAIVRSVLLSAIVLTVIGLVAFRSGEQMPLVDVLRNQEVPREVRTELDQLRQLVDDLARKSQAQSAGNSQATGKADTKDLASELADLKNDVHALRSTVADIGGQSRTDVNAGTLAEFVKSDDRFNWLTSMVLHSQGFLDKHAESIDDWLSANEREYRTFTPSREGYPSFKNVSQCEAIVEDILTLDSGFDPHHGVAVPALNNDFYKSDWQQAEPHTIPKGICNYYWKLQQVKTCRPAGSRSFIFHAMNVIVPEHIRDWLARLRAKISQFEVDGVVYYTFLHMQPESQTHRWRGSTMLEWAVTNALSFKRAFGKFPLIIANDRRSFDAITAAGIPSILDETPFWRGSYVNGDFRKLSRTTLTKYVYAYFIIEMGLTAFFFDTDSYWMRKPILPPPGQYDILGMVESPGIHATRNETVHTDHHNFRRVNFGYRLREYSWCGKHVDYVPITSGVWAAYPTEWALRLLSNYLDFAFIAGDFWWEQNLWSYLLIQYTGWGLRWGNFPLESFTGGNRGEFKDEAMCRDQEKIVWVHTKFVKQSFGVCSQFINYVPPAGHSDVIPGSITLRLLDDA